ncbi:restriction endonuclease [Vagococcus luciliae]|uniref:Restriction endonuclease type IV Mrr domain-containing protein n=1 Tax=Vagococcus luciliae TaxID=2920380 RepID=A0ABY5NXL4_9ENTE|nr:restriction endonuclease [Vagococcus luciliae]UUV98233.1 hypothetical protein G314FT_03250 [Vagococcus luciliae]
MNLITKITFTFLYLFSLLLLMASISTKEFITTGIVVLPIIALTILFRQFRKYFKRKKELTEIKRELRIATRRYQRQQKRLQQTEDRLSKKDANYHQLKTDIKKRKKELQRVERKLHHLNKQIDDTLMSNTHVKDNRLNQKQLNMTHEKLVAYQKDVKKVKKQLRQYQRIQHKIQHLLIEDELRKIDNMTGRQFEIYLAKLLSINGYRTEVTQASGDQGVDIIAKKNGQTYAFQAKRYVNPVSNKAVQEVFSGKQYYNLQHASVVTNNTFTKSAKELAEKTHVTLMDRGQLRQLLEQAIKVKPEKFIL